MTTEDMEKLQQIPDLQVEEKLKVDDQEVTVALLNMGGPRTNADVPDFQRRLFTDSLLIRFPMSWAFQKLFASILIALRSKATRERYQLIGGGSPIFESTKAQAQALQKELDRRGRPIGVTFSFNYSSPLPEETIREVKRDGKKYILPLSLYPHYSRATTGSNIYYLRKAAAADYPQLKFLKASSYFLHPGYIRAFRDRVREAVGPEGALDDFYLLFSAHGLPLYFLTEGDLYPYQIAQTVAALLGEMGRKDRWVLAYQSAVGPLQWLKPSIEDMIAALARRGVKKMLVIPISFVTDHIETTCEIDMEYRQAAEKLGVTDFRMSKAIECHPGFIEALADTVEDAVRNRDAGGGKPEGSLERALRR
jgi:ferrochelatase